MRLQPPTLNGLPALPKLGGLGLPPLPGAGSTLAPKRQWVGAAAAVALPAPVKLALEAQFEESHPELCFFLLNDSTKLNNPKHTQKGINERIKILERFQPNISNIYGLALKKHLRKDVKKDDIIDSLALLISLIHKKETKYIESEHISDQKNITMRIVYPNLNL